MKNNNSDSDFKDLQFVDLRLQNGQVELILRAMELYGYNLKFMVNDTDITTEERSRKQAKLEYTYLSTITTLPSPSQPRIILAASRLSSAYNSATT